MPGSYARIVLPEIDSTNAEAMRRARDGARGPLWIAANRQTAGRGRSGRVWISEPGNLHASLMLDLMCGAEAASRLSLVAGVAALDALGGLGDIEPRLKWPNDILLGGAKMGGILIETSAFGPARGLVAAIGIGLNLAHAPSDPPNATSLRAHGIEIAPLAMLDRLARAMESWLAAWREGEGFPLVRQAWLDGAGPLGEPMSVNTGHGPETGRYAGIDADGALLMDGAAGRRRFTFGDVTLPGGPRAPAGSANSD